MELKILCVHGVGNHPMGGPWEGEWRRSIEEPLKEIDPAVVPVIEFVHLDEAFNRYKITPIDVIQALGKLAKSGAMALFRQPKGLGDQIRWTAGMVPLRGELRLGIRLLPLRRNDAHKRAQGQGR